MLLLFVTNTLATRTDPGDSRQSLSSSCILSRFHFNGPPRTIITVIIVIVVIRKRYTHQQNKWTINQKARVSFRALGAFPGQHHQETTQNFILRLMAI